MIEIRSEPDPKRKVWLDLIEAAKRALPCWNIDSSTILERFLSFNRSRGNSSVPAGFLLGFMRKWRLAPGAKAQAPGPADAIADKKILLVQKMVRHAPPKNREFHRQDLQRLIGAPAYEGRIAAIVAKLGLGKFAAALAVHGEAVSLGEIAP